MFIFLEHFKSHKKGGENFKNSVFIYYKLESQYKKSSKFEEVMVQNQKKKCLISKGIRQIVIKYTKN
jgi:hypothetical protein